GLKDNIKLPIDPFSTAYWDTPAEVKQAQADNKDVRKDITSQPLNPTRSTLTGPVFNISTATSKTKRTFPADQLAEFKQVIQGSNLTKAGLTEVLKKRFPKVSKDVIRDTLTAVAVRSGAREVDKKWVLI
ncbi:Transcriptional regulatory protein sin3, partial [Ascosphaera pollenicola]